MTRWPLQMKNRMWTTAMLTNGRVQPQRFARSGLLASALHPLRGLVLSSLVIASGCSQPDTMPERAATGADPVLPSPDRSLIPVVDIAPARGWPSGTTPAPAPGLAVNAFASGLDHPRWIAVLPNGDVLVAETNAPPDSGAIKGLKGMAMKAVMKRAGAAVPSANRITLLRDADGDGTAEIRSPFITGLRSPFGMALVGDTLYVANADALLAFAYTAGQTHIDDPGRTVAPLPNGPGPLNHHWTKSLVANADGTRLYVGVGSNSNIAEGGMDKETNRAAILEIDPRSGASRVFASGLRNPVGIAFEPSTGVLWTVVNERDELGNDLVPDYLTSVRDGGFYGWPWSYYGAHVDTRVTPKNPERVAQALSPDYALGSHVAPLGLAFTQGSALPTRFAHGAVIGEHGSWNRKPPSGYEVVFVPFTAGRPSGAPQTLVSGFVAPNGDAYGRPVGVVIDSRGALLVADDVGNVIWRVTGTPQSPGGGS
jgi:glucose/arabinose dehydrogenase